MVGTLHPYCLLRFRNRPRRCTSFPLAQFSQNGPRHQGFATPRLFGSPLTAPGRSDERILTRGKGRNWKQAADHGLPSIGNEALWTFRDGKHTRDRRHH